MAECVGGRTDPDLWERSKKKAIEKLGGRFSARAMQLAGKLYRDAGGGYCGEKTKAQKSMSKWTDEDWTTADDKPARREVDGKEVYDRYLPRKAWSKLTKAQKAATRKKKRASDAQFVPNTAKAAKAGKSARGESMSYLESKDLPLFCNAMVAHGAGRVAGTRRTMPCQSPVVFVDTDGKGYCAKHGADYGYKPPEKPKKRSWLVLYTDANGKKTYRYVWDSVSERGVRQVFKKDEPGGTIDAIFPYEGDAAFKNSPEFSKWKAWWPSNESRKPNEAIQRLSDSRATDMARLKKLAGI